MKKKKLLFLINDLSFFLSHRLPIAESLIDKGFNVVIGYGNLGGANIIDLKKNGIKFKYVPIHQGRLNLFRELKSFIYIWNFFKKEKPDIIHLVTIKPYIYGGIISKILNTPGLVIAVSGLGSLFISNNFKNRLIRQILYPFYKFAFSHKNQKIIFHNKDDAKLLVKWGVLNPSKMKLIKGSGVNLDNFTNLKEPKGKIVVCFASRLLRDKGIYEFVQAAEILKKRGVSAKFYLVGEIDKKNPSSISSHDLNKIKKRGHVQVLGFKKNISKIYQNSHIVCLPSYREGLPKSLIEAAAACRPIVTTNVPGCRDSIIPNKTGLLVPVKDAVRLANSIQWLINNPNKRISMGRAGRQLAKKEFQIKNVVQKHLAIYKYLSNTSKKF